METKFSQPECQIHSLERMSVPLGRIEKVWQIRNRFKRIIKRRIRYIRNWLITATHAQNENPTSAAQSELRAFQAGDLVRVRSKEQIQATLDNWNRLKGCDFMEEMWAYCGETQRVLKRVDKFLDERTYTIRKSRGIVVLEGVMCTGTWDLGACDRCCLFFWREEWLEKID